MSVPQIFHQIWVPPGEENDPKVETSKNSWVKHNPGWVHFLWHDRYLGWLQHRDLYDDAPNLVPADAVGQFRSDIARLEILHKFGGMYVDCDTICMRPIETALAGHDAWAAAEDAVWVGNTYLAAKAHHPVFAELVEKLRENVTRNKGRGLRPNRLSGPRYLTPIWNRHGCYVAPSRLWFPYSYVDLKRGKVPTYVSKEVYSVHQWRHTEEILQERK